MNLLDINCSPVRTGATSEIVKIVSEKLSSTFIWKLNVAINLVYALWNLRKMSKIEKMK